MATVYGTNATKRDNSTPATKIDSNENHARLRIAYDEYVATSDFTAADVIKMMKIPKGCKVYNAWLDSPQLGSGGGNGELDFGYEANGSDAADVDAFYDGAEVGSAAFSGEMLDVRTHAGIGFEPAAETQCIVTVNETTDAITSATIACWVMYALD